MKVRQILKRKGSNDVASIPPEATLQDAAAKLLELGIGCLMVSDGGDSFEGILSERDIVRAIGRDAGACLDNRVSSVMTANVITCGIEDSSDEVLGKMSQGRFRHVPVIEDGKLAGLISIGDVVKARIEALEHDNEALEGMIRSATG